ncbi:IDEAL domain-containing protein [Risungbinella massiliensis]|uniref:IDEAL domain-containing protein n=1 Tax=Risungbinella massiliensis TaxID=1329796 RepID=UPI00069B90D8|nr:IDEAL domain-containing protein [Risungbinella massiliensis]
MTWINNSPLKEGDWVKGKSRDGELLFGYLQNIDLTKGLAMIYVVECDNDQQTGKTMVLQTKAIERLPISTTKNEHQLAQLIDLALQTKDEKWFMDLSTELNAIRTTSKQNTNLDDTSPHRNRLYK